MNLSDIDKSYNASLKPKWFYFNDSALSISFIKSCEELKIAPKNLEISTDQLALLLSENILHDWVGIKDIFGKDIEFNKQNAFNALSKDLEFLKLVVEVSFKQSNFIGV